MNINNTYPPTTNSDYYFVPQYNSPQFNNKLKDSSNPFYDVHSIRKDFPILNQRISGTSLIWLDNAATTQKPYPVIQVITDYYNNYNSNVHRGAHTLSKVATKAMEDARKNIKRFINAASDEEIIFVRGATEAINLVANTYGDMAINEGDEIILTSMEHHSNIVPWQNLKETKGASLKYVPINEQGELIIEEYEKLFTNKTKLIAITQVSNVLGTINPIKEMIEIAHKHGAYVLIDGAQAAPHVNIDVIALDADFYVFSGHKIYGPTGIGVLYGKKAILEKLPPWQKGGGMIKDVNYDHSTFNHLPHKFEAGTSNIAGTISLSKAIDYINNIGIDNIQKHEKELTQNCLNMLSEMNGVKLIGTAPNKTSVISFVVKNQSPDSVANYLNQHGIAVRSGHHCAQPALRTYGIDSCVRASIGMYNTMEEINNLVDVVRKIAY